MVKRRRRQWGKGSVDLAANGTWKTGSYWGTMAGAIVLTLITSLLTTMQMPDSVRRMVLGTTLLVLISIYGRQQALRQ